MHWFCATVTPGKHRIAKLVLDERSFDTYLPLYVAGWKNNKEKIVRPFLPGYIFVRMNLDDPNERWRLLRTTIGIRDVLGSAERPTVVQDWVIEGIMDREVLGLVQLEPRQQCNFAKGAVVRLRGSPLDALFHEAIDYKRGIILVRIFDRQYQKEVLLSKLTAAG